MPHAVENFAPVTDAYQTAEKGITGVKHCTAINTNSSDHTLHGKRLPVLLAPAAVGDSLARRSATGPWRTPDQPPTRIVPQTIAPGNDRRRTNKGGETHEDRRRRTRKGL